MHSFFFLNNRFYNKFKFGLKSYKSWRYSMDNSFKHFYGTKTIELINSHGRKTYDRWKFRKYAKCTHFIINRNYKGL